ncbi:MAG: metal ABC transporter permease [Desulfurococcales archaeon]|nr:metal ABC transporter permease [Desulfurococcales archaeon]
MRVYLASAAAGFLLLSYPVVEGYPARWSIVLGMAGIALGSISLLVYVRRLLFAAASAPHAAFFAASLALIISSSLGGDLLLWTVLAGTLIIYSLGYAVYSGMDPDDATALFASLTTSLGVVTMYYAITHYSTGASLSSIVLGDPLLASREEIAYAAVIGTAALMASLAAAREISYMGVDREDAKLSGIRTWAYDLALFTLLALTVVGLVRVVGFAVEHVLVLIPGAVATMHSRGPTHAVLASVSLSLLASGLALVTGVLLNLSPSGLIGVFMVTIYAVAVALGWRK